MNRQDTLLEPLVIQEPPHSAYPVTMSFFNTTATLHHVTPLPAGATFETALDKLQDHDLLIRLDPELAHYETLPALEDSPKTCRYKVTDHMHTLPKGLWDTTVTFESLITNTSDGVEWVIKAPLGLSQTTTWRLVRNSELKGGQDENGNEDGGPGFREELDGWSLVEDVEIRGSRLLVGTVKGKCEENWKGIHARYVSQVTGVTATSPGTDPHEG
ncbi:uncharacterized protein EI97DRAFT_421628 [Westerdykella ornata]|uniref:DUF7053 domain-containing protein n=1 Tax=Westerdykella ornata TaxID=318751 RepID=A0A6A6JI38_WESOR|nr:uncharacterized protein EI97DRAFT_421628 [Westerdykella ornata]KAF2274919.1 hypothetical protein EI97DRAFT_421628 [Westerdykella ornata]